MSLARYSLGEMRRQPRRTMLTLLGIVIGVGAIVSIGLALESARASYSRLFEVMGGQASLEVATPARTAYDADEVDIVGRVRGVTAAVPVISTFAAIARDNGVTPIAILGLEAHHADALYDVPVREGAAPERDDDLLLPYDFALQAGIGVSDVVTLVAAGGLRTVRVCGLYGGHGPGGVLGAVAIATPAGGRALAGFDSGVNAVQIVLAPGADTASVREAIAATLPPNLQVLDIAARGRIVAQTNYATELGFSVLSFVSLVAGGFVILNAFLMSLHERRRTLAILRALGATQRDVTRLLVREALLMAVIGTVLGAALGTVASIGFNRVLEAMLQVASVPWRPAAMPYILAAILGPGIAVAATFVPARRAGRISPLAALVDAGEARADQPPLRWSFLGALLLMLLTALVIALRTTAIPTDVTRVLLPIGMAMAIVGAALVIPPFVGPMLRVLGRPLRRVFGIEAAIATRQLLRHPIRTHLTVCVLAVALTVAIGFGSSMLGNVDNVRAWARRVASVDFLVRSFIPDPTVIIAGGLPQEMADEVASLDGVAAVAQAHFGVGTVAGEQALLVARTIPEDFPLQIQIVEGDPERVHARMRAGEIVVGSLIAQRRELHPGDEIELATLAGPRLLRVAAISNEYSGGGLLAQLEWNTARELLGIDTAHVLFVTAAPGRYDEAHRSVDTYCKAHHLKYESRTEFRAMVDAAMAGVVGSLWGLLLLTFLVASFGVINTLTMNVLAQTRELGVLRAIAMTRRQIARLVVLQAGAMAAVSVPPGVLFGALFAWAMHATIYPITGQHVEFVLRVGLMAGCAVVCVIVSVLSATSPARRAGAMSVIQAIQYE